MKIIIRESLKQGNITTGILRGRCRRTDGHRLSRPPGRLGMPGQRSLRGRSKQVPLGRIGFFKAELFRNKVQLRQALEPVIIAETGRSRLEKESCQVDAGLKAAAFAAPVELAGSAVKLDLKGHRLITQDKNPEPLVLFFEIINPVFPIESPRFGQDIRFEMISKCRRQYFQ
jgi:hypothetical protein